MQLARILSSSGIALTLFVGVGCSSVTNWPRWAERVSGQVRCGMGLEDLDAITDLDLRKRPRVDGLERFAVSKRNTDLHFYLGAGGLESIALSKLEGWKSTRLSPIRNLCTGDTQFSLLMSWTEDLVGASIYLDEGLADISIGDRFLIASGEHHLRVEKEGYISAERLLDFGPNDRGDPQVYLRACETEDGPQIHIVELERQADFGTVLAPGWCQNHPAS